MKYESNLSLLDTDFDIWLTSTSFQDATTELSTELSPPQDSDNIDKRYEQLLQDIELYCQDILKETNDISELLHQTQINQDQLFDTFTQVSRSLLSPFPLRHSVCFIA
jgi:DNA replication protein DnaD